MACYSSWGAVVWITVEVVVAQFSGMAVIMDKRERMRRFVSTRRDISLLLIVFVLLLD